MDQKTDITAESSENPENAIPFIPAALTNLAEQRKHTLEQLSDPERDLERQKRHVRDKYGALAWEESQAKIKQHACRDNAHLVMDAILRRDGHSGFFKNMSELLSCLKNGKPS